MSISAARCETLMAVLFLCYKQARCHTLVFKLGQILRFLKSQEIEI